MLLGTQQNNPFMSVRPLFGFAMKLQSRQHSR